MSSAFLFVININYRNQFLSSDVMINDLIISFDRKEIVPLRKVCRRPETDYRLRILRSTKAQAAMDSGATAKHLVPPPQRPQNQEKPGGDTAEEEAVNSPPPSPPSEPAQMEISPIAGETNEGVVVPEAMAGASAAAGGEVPSGGGTA